uniref:Uncharacterized protein n=1 Tax=Heterorhabditis bacteriophora TaxID=37862 RepID=A0A1I7W8A7_HETBA
MGKYKITLNFLKSNIYSYNSTTLIYYLGVDKKL